MKIKLDDLLKNPKILDKYFKNNVVNEELLKFTDEAIENYFIKKVPLCGVLGGGYNKDFDKLIELHSKLHKSCASFI